MDIPTQRSVTVIASGLRLRRIRLPLAAVIGLATVLGSLGGSAQAGPEDTQSRVGDHGRPFTVALFGDDGYGDDGYGDAGRAEFPALRADIDRARPAFSLYDGDLKNGKERCDDSLYTTAKSNLNAFDRPVVVVPGDNDWTDCHRANNGAFDPIERLNFERSVLYSTLESLGAHPIRLDRQTPDYPENYRFTAGPVTFVGLNVQGSNDNFPHAGVDGEARPAAEIAREDAEHVAREQANIAWLHATFAAATQRHDRAVVVDWQGDPNFTNEMALPDPRSYDGFTEIVAALRAETLAFPARWPWCTATATTSRSTSR